jgi:hypothetical protein
MAIKLPSIFFLRIERPDKNATKPSIMTATSATAKKITNTRAFKLRLKILDIIPPLFLK